VDHSLAGALTTFPTKASFLPSVPKTTYKQTLAFHVAKTFAGLQKKQKQKKTLSYSKRNACIIVGSCHKRQKPQAPTPQAPIRNRQTVTAKREKSQAPKVLTAILTLPNLT